MRSVQINFDETLLERKKTLPSIKKNTENFTEIRTFLGIRIKKLMK